MIHNILIPIYEILKWEILTYIKKEVIDYQCFILTKTLHFPSTKPMWMNLRYNIVTRDVQLTN